MKSKTITIPCRVGDKAYYVSEDKIYRITISSIEITYSGIVIRPYCKYQEVPELIFYNTDSNKLFFSLAELIQSNVKVAEREFI